MVVTRRLYRSDSAKVLAVGEAGSSQRLNADECARSQSIVNVLGHY